MANTIRLKRSGVSGAIPATADLTTGELAINFADGKLFARKENAGVASIVEIGGSGGPSGPILYSHQVIGSSITFPAGYNGVSAGDVEIANGAAVELPSSSVWVIL